MPVDFLSKWVRKGVPFPFNEPYTLSDVGADELHFDVPSATPQSVDGEFQQDSRMEARAVTIAGVLTADNPQQLRDRWDTLSGALCGRAVGQFYKHSDRYINGHVVSLQRPTDDGLNRIEWSAALKCGDPLWYDPTIQTVTLGTTSGSMTPLTPGGNWPALPVFTFVVSAVGILTLSGMNGGAFALAASVAGTYKVDCTAGTVQVNDTDALGQFNGNFFEEGIGPGGDVITLLLSGSAALSSASVTWLRRYTSA